MVDHFLMRLQANGQALRIFGEERAKRILVFLSLVFELPVIDRPER